MDREMIFGMTPWLELAIRKLYYTDNKIVKKVVSLIMLIRKNRNNRKSRTKSEISADKTKWLIIKDYIRELNIKEGDLLIVHSSTEELSKIGANPKDVLMFLSEIVGNQGTLAIPCFPLYDKKNFDTGKGLYIFDPKRTLCSTGLLPNLFLRQPGVVRSLFPWNTLAAQGPCAAEMMKHNLETDLAHGRGSTWEFCYRNHAKILLLGVKSSRTTTMVHVAEDILDEKWPIDEWYENKRIVLQTKQKEKIVSIRVRKPYWAKYNASWYRSYCLKKDSILSEKQINGFNIGFIKDSQVLVDYIVDRTLEHRPFFAVPKRCYKR